MFLGRYLKIASVFAVILSCVSTSNLAALTRPASIAAAKQEIAREIKEKGSVDVGKYIGDTYKQLFPSGVILLEAELKEVQTGKDGAFSSFYATGKISMFGTGIVAAQIGFVTTKHLGVGAIFRIFLPRGWQIGNSFQLGKTVATNFNLDHAELWISTIQAKLEAYDEEGDTELMFGINLKAKLRLGGPLEKITKSIGSGVTSLELRGALPSVNPITKKRNPLFLSAQYPAGIKLSKTVTFKEIMLEFKKATSVGLTIDINVTVPNQKKPLEFIAQGEVNFSETGSSYKLSGTMKNKWENMFGLKGLSLGNIAIEVPFKPGVPMVPSDIAITGELDLDKYKVRMAYKMDKTNPYKTVLLGQINYIEIQYLFLPQLAMAEAAAQAAGSTISLPIAFKDVKLYIAPSGGSIGGFTFYRGFTGRGYLVAPFFKTGAELNLDYTGFIIKAEFTNQLGELMRQGIVNDMEKFKANANRDLNKAMTDVDKIDGDINKLTKQINAKNERIAQLRRELSRVAFKASELYDYQQRHFAQSGIATLGAFKKPPRYLAFWGEVGDFFEETTDAAAQAAAREAERIKREAERKAREAAEATRREAERVARITARKAAITEEMSKLGIEVGALETKRAILYASRDTAHGILVAARKTAKAVATAVSTVANALVIKRIYGEGKLQRTGGLQGGIELTVLGKPFSVKGELPLYGNKDAVINTFLKPQIDAAVKWIDQNHKLSKRY